MLRKISCFMIFVLLATSESRCCYERGWETRWSGDCESYRNRIFLTTKVHNGSATTWEKLLRKQFSFCDREEEDFELNWDRSRGGGRAALLSAFRWKIIAAAERAAFARCSLHVGTWGKVHKIARAARKVDQKAMNIKPALNAKINVSIKQWRWKNVPDTMGLQSGSQMTLTKFVMTS